MANHVFTEDVLKILHEAGWREDRKADVQPYLEAFREEKLTVFPCVVTFLKNFGGLQIRYVNTLGKEEDINFDLCNTNALDCESVKDDSMDIRLALCPFGDFQEEWSYLLMDKEGKTYFRYQDGIYFAGNTGEEALQLLISGGSAKKIWP